MGRLQPSVLQRATLPLFDLSGARYCLVLAGLLAIIATARPGQGEVLQNGAAPVAGTLNRTGLRIEVESRFVEGAGYTPYRVRLLTSPAFPSAEDRTINVRLVVSSYPSVDMVSKELTLKAGATEVEDTIYLTKTKGIHGDQVQVICMEGGRELGALRLFLMGRNTNRNNNAEMLSSVLFVDDDAPPRAKRKEVIDRLFGSQDPARLPDFRQLSGTLCGFSSGITYSSPNKEKPKAADDARLLVDVGSMERADLMPTSELPTEWLALSNFDVVFIPWPELKTLRATNDERWSALRQWLAVGHTLVVYDVGAEFAALRDLERSLQIPAIPANAANEKHPGWQAPRINLFGKPLPRADAAGSMQRLPNGVMAYVQDRTADEQAKRDEEKNAKDKPKPPDDAFKFCLREVGLGLVVAIDAQQPFPGNGQVWDWVFTEVGENRFRPLSRLGVAKFGENPDFGSFLVRNVGQAPIWMFLTLITLFMLLIGPINYFVLRRKRRLHLLLVTVPVSAGLVTFGLLAYAVISDGFHTRSRVRSVTFLDQPAGLSASWSRQVFFAGLSPSGGLAYPETAVVHPIDRWGVYGGERHTRLTAWNDGQRLVQGFIPPRTMSQFMVLNAQPCKQGLRVTMAAEGAASCRVRNETEANFEELAIFDEKGRVYVARNLAAGDEIVLQESPRMTAVNPFRGEVIEQSLKTPPWDDSRSFRRRRFMWFSPQFPASQYTSLLEQMIVRGDFAKVQPPPRSYLGVVREPIEVPVGVVAHEKQADLNLVWGAW